MRIVAGTEAPAVAELENTWRLGVLLGAEVPSDWPPESIRDALPMFLSRCRASATCGCWTLGWYSLLRREGSSVLCGSVGFKGPPREGVVEIGYSVLPAFECRGLATEMVEALTRWALEKPAVAFVEAETEDPNAASRRVLEKANFTACGPGIEPGTMRFRCAAPGHWTRDGGWRAL